MYKRITLSMVPITSVFQPIVELSTEKIFGYESLMRGRLTSDLPEKLFRDAYKEGCVAEFDIRALKISLQSIPKLQKNKVMFINIEPITLGECFGKRSNAEPLLKMIRPYSKKIVFELTERLKPWDFGFVKKGINVLKKGGFKFALDDVGGVSSELLRLMTLKPDFMKIDKGLVQNISRKPYQRESLFKLVEFGKKKNVKMIAEGVEKKADVEFIRQLGVQYVQGYYYARPNATMYATLKSYRS